MSDNKKQETRGNIIFNLWTKLQHGEILTRRQIQNRETEIMRVAAAQVGARIDQPDTDLINSVIETEVKRRIGS